MSNESSKTLENQNQEPKSEISEDTLTEVREMFSALVKLAANADQSIQFPTPEEIVSTNHYIILADDQLQEKYRSLCSLDTAESVGGFLDTQTGDVYIAKSHKDNPHVILHESVHRSQWLFTNHQGKNLVTSFTGQLAKQYGFELQNQGVIDLNKGYLSCIADKKERSELLSFFNPILVKQSSEVLEGLTEYATQAGLATAAKENANDIWVAYLLKVLKVDKLQRLLMQGERLTQSQAQESILAAALTGEISKLLPYYGGSFLQIPSH